MDKNSTIYETKLRSYGDAAMKYRRGMIDFNEFMEYCNVAERKAHEELDQLDLVK